MRVSTTESMDLSPPVLLRAYSNMPKMPEPLSEADLRLTGSVLGSMIDVVTFSDAVSRIGGWAQAGESRYVCICNVHSVVTGTRQPKFKQVIDGADMATADGAPVAWMMRRTIGVPQERVSGPDLMLAYCEWASRSGQAIFLLGGMPDTLDKLEAAMLRRFPGLKIAGTYSPPFRALTVEEDESIVAMINDSGASTVWVGLGCPKQEYWMAEHRGRVNAVMIGVGAAFEFHAGTTPRAPKWMQDAGLEWLHRLMSEPRRLWRRYLTTNCAFIVGAARQLMQPRLRH